MFPGKSLKNLLTTNEVVGTMQSMNNTNITTDPAFQALVADSFVKINDTVTVNLIAAGVSTDVDGDSIYAEALDSSVPSF